MFVELKQLLGQSSEIVITVRADGDKMKVIVSPKVTDAKAEIALSRPLAMCETAEVLDAGFIEAIQGFTASRASLVEQVAVTTTILKAAEQDQAKKALTRSNVKPGAGKPSAGQPSVTAEVPLSDQHEPEPFSGFGGQGNGTVTLPASASTGKQETSADSALQDLDI